MAELADLPVMRPHGGWSMFIDTRQLGLDPADASRRLLERARVAAMPMTHWGPQAGRYLRFVFANESVARLREIRERVRATWVQ
jgi:aspartate/methionine/tyrosine aminotransferase